MIECTTLERITNMFESAIDQNIAKWEGKRYCANPWEGWACQCQCCLTAEQAYEENWPDTRWS
jgi:hypothetical protein